jgi:hypothetical protein
MAGDRPKFVEQGALGFPETGASPVAADRPGHVMEVLLLSSMARWVHEAGFWAAIGAGRDGEEERSQVEKR